MEIIQNIIEYYDELYPISEAQKNFYRELTNLYQDPAKLLRVGCGTGFFEHLLAREGKDVTGIEDFPELLRSANLRRRNQLMSIRFFQMSYLDMVRFLGKGFYNIISILEDRITSIHDRTLLRKFFFDSKQLLCKDGSLVIGMYNYDKFKDSTKFDLPARESLRTKLFSSIGIRDDGQAILKQSVETGSGKLLPVTQDKPVYLLHTKEIELFAKEAGFKNINFYADYSKTPFTGEQDSFIALIS